MLYQCLPADLVLSLYWTGHVQPVVRANLVDSPFETMSLTVFFARFRLLSESLPQTQFRTFHTSLSACVSFGRWSLTES